jgi:hypothetical protein
LQILILISSPGILCPLSHILTKGALIPKAFATCACVSSPLRERNLIPIFILSIKSPFYGFP